MAATVPAAASMRMIRHELDSGQYGSAQENVDQLTASVALGGFVGCARHPVVLLYGLVHPQVSAATLRSGQHTRPFWRVAMPADLRVHGVLGYGFLTADATLQMKSRSGKLIYSETYPGPPSYHDCARGSESVSFLFSN